MPYESRVLSILETPVNTLYRLNEPSKRHFPLVFHRFRGYFIHTPCNLLYVPITTPYSNARLKGALCRPLRRHLPIRGGIPLASRRRAMCGSLGVVMASMMFHASGTRARAVCTLLPQVHGLWERRPSSIFSSRKDKSAPRRSYGILSLVTELD